MVKLTYVGGAMNGQIREHEDDITEMSVSNSEYGTRDNRPVFRLHPQGKYIRDGEQMIWRANSR